LWWFKGEGGKAVMVVAVAVAVAVVVVALAAVAVVVQKQRCMLRIDLIVTSMFCKIGLQIHVLSCQERASTF
jgi:hypothetical protein